MTCVSELARQQRHSSRCPIRFALYFTPPADHPLVGRAASWLGRDAFGGETMAVPEARANVTESARRYGFHATLKAPFRLHEGESVEALETALDRFVRETAPVTIPVLALQQLGRFFALVPDEQPAELTALAARVVEAFEPFRAPLSEAEIAKRSPETLPKPERDNLLRWGYPYVMDAFRFHMTLTDKIAPEESDTMRAALEREFAPFIGKPLAVDHLALFVEPEPGAPFTVQKLVELEGRA
jgi:putative phosphonate metabolism protein